MNDHYVAQLEEIIALMYFESDDEIPFTDEQRKICQRCFNVYYPDYDGSW